MKTQSCWPLPYLVTGKSAIPEQRLYASGGIDGRFDLGFPLIAKIKDELGGLTTPIAAMIITPGDVLDRGMNATMTSWNS